MRYLYLQGWFAKVRIGRRQGRVPVVVRLGVCGDGARIVIDMRLGGNESAEAWGEVIQSPVERHVGVPELAVIDGSAGLREALEQRWPKLKV